MPAKSLAHKAVLEQLGTNQVFPKNVSEAMDMLSDVVKLIEGGSFTKAASEEVDVLAYFVKIEARTL